MKKEESAIRSNQENPNKNTNIQLIYPELSAEPLFVYADKNRIQQVLSNLLSNALKFTEDGVITINTEKFLDKINNNANNKENEFVSIKIKDTGKGIDPEVLPRLFEKFATKSDKGTGLVYIFQKILWKLMVERYGERIIIIIDMEKMVQNLVLLYHYIIIRMFELSI
jgi:signal transduction histidine kinase